MVTGGAPLRGHQSRHRCGGRRPTRWPPPPTSTPPSPPHRAAQRGWASARHRSTAPRCWPSWPSWMATPAPTRFIAEEVSQTGKPVRLATEFDVPGSIDNVSFFAGAARHLEGKATAEYSGDHTSSIRREAVGVVATITPWNYPLQMAVWKVIPALAAGCSRRDQTRRAHAADHPDPGPGGQRGRAARRGVQRGHRAGRRCGHRAGRAPRRRRRDRSPGRPRWAAR